MDLLSIAVAGARVATYHNIGGPFFIDWESWPATARHPDRRENYVIVTPLVPMIAAF